MIRLFSILVPLVLLLCPAPALAVQVHGGMEGFLVHVFGHLLFSSSIVFILFFLGRHPFGRGRKWTYFRLSMLFFLAWNLDTLTNHVLLQAMIDEDVMLKGFFLRHYVSAPLTLAKMAYYLTSFDHVICVPAMLFLALSLRSFCQETEAQEGRRRQ